MQYVWQSHGEEHKNEYPLAAEAVEKNCYMDDLMPSVKDVETAKNMRKELTTLGDKAGFHIRKWISSRPEVIEDIPENDRASEIDLQKNQLPTTKTLGVLWSTKDDTFFFVYSSPSSQFKFTKRNVLKKTATVFDPLGFISPFIIRAKLLIQQAWLETIAWDDELPSSLRKKWEQWFNELPELQQVKIPRCLKDNESIVQETSIHTFTDASQKAYTAVVYARHEYEDETVSCRLITSKTRLANSTTRLTQQMAPLPKILLERTMKPFTNTAVDYGGPYLTKQGRGKSRQKRYLCLFLCLQTHEPRTFCH